MFKKKSHKHGLFSRPDKYNYGYGPHNGYGHHSGYGQQQPTQINVMVVPQKQGRQGYPMTTGLGPVPPAMGAPVGGPAGAPAFTSPPQPPMAAYSTTQTRTTHYSIPTPQSAWSQVPTAIPPQETWQPSPQGPPAGGSGCPYPPMAQSTPAAMPLPRQESVGFESITTCTQVQGGYPPPPYPPAPPGYTPQSSGW